MDARVKPEHDKKSHPELASGSHLQDAEKVQHNALCGIYMKKVLVLGCTGSIGTSTLDIINNQSDEFCVCGLQANSNKDKLLKLLPHPIQKTHTVPCFLYLLRQHFCNPL